MITTSAQRRLHVTPGHCLAALLAFDGLLFLPQWFRWLPKGWPVLIAVAAICVVMQSRSCSPSYKSNPSNKEPFDLMAKGLDFKQRLGGGSFSSAA
jgi:hypothetical protein